MSVYLEFEDTYDPPNRERKIKLCTSFHHIVAIWSICPDVRLAENLRLDCFPKCRHFMRHT